MSKYKLGLALSGGGMCCAAQIGVLKLWEDNNISPSIISGTSGGAIIGALLANRVPCDEILNVFQKVNLFSFSHFALRKAGLFDIESYKLLEPYFPKDRFEALQIPLIINATQLQKGEITYFSTGKLIKKLFASAAFPGLFAPVNISNQLYADGGIIENLSTQIIRKKCEQLIAINVNLTPEISSTKMSNTLEVMSRALRLSLAQQQNYRPQDCDLMIAPKAIAQYLHFSKNSLEELYEIGYQEGKKTLPQVQRLLNSN